jgi:hypothetical protein
MEEKKKDGRGGARIGAGRKSVREEAGLIQKLKPFEDEVLLILMQLVRGGDIQAVKIYLAYLAGNPTTTNNTNIQAEVTSVDLRDIITFTSKDDDNDDIS